MYTVIKIDKPTKYCRSEIMDGVGERGKLPAFGGIPLHTDVKIYFIRVRI
jgi:hypothetical protein